MSIQNQIYRCEICGDIVELVQGQKGKPVCCDERMKHLEEKSADKATEKHVPVVEKTADGYKVTVGTTLHPMIDSHFIQWIELVADEFVYRRYLKPGDQPIAEFAVKSASKVWAREYCNLHGLWKGE